MMFCDVLALRKMQQDKAAANPQKKNNMKKTATKWMGTSRITTKNVAAESSSLCASFC